MYDSQMNSVLYLDEEEEEDGDVSDRESDNGLPQVTLPNPVSIKENILTKGKRKKRDSTRKLAQKEIKHSKRKVKHAYALYLDWHKPSY